MIFVESSQGNVCCLELRKGQFQFWCWVQPVVLECEFYEINYEHRFDCAESLWLLDKLMNNFLWFCSNNLAIHHYNIILQCTIANLILL